jgi:type IV secretion system protein VirD4
MTAFSLLASFLVCFYVGLLVFEDICGFQPISILGLYRLPEYGNEFYTFLIIELIAFIPIYCWIGYKISNIDFGNKPFGNAHFLSINTIAKHNFLEQEDGAVILAKKSGQTIYSNGFEHVLLFAATGSGKTTSVSMPNLFSYPYSVVTNDVKLSLYQKTSGYRESVLGHTCYVWAVADPQGQTHRYNPLTFISTDKIQRITDIQRIAHAFIPDVRGENAIFPKLSRSLFKALLLFLIDSKNHKVSFGEMNRLIKKPDFESWLYKTLMETENFDDEFYRNGFAYLDINERTRSSVFADLISHLELFDDPRVDAATSESDFDLSDLRKKKITIYVSFSDDDTDRLSPIITLFWQQLIATMIRKVPDLKEEPYPLLCLIDEFSALGRLDQLRKSLKLLREYRVKCVLMIQYLGQMLEKYNQSEAKAFTNIKTKMALLTDDYEDAKYISSLMGEQTKKIASTTISSQEKGSSHSKNYQYQAVPLMRPDEIMKIDTTTALILRTGVNPIKAKQYRYYQDRKMKTYNFTPTYIPTVEPIVFKFDHSQKGSESSEKKDDIKNDEFFGEVVLD